MKTEFPLPYFTSTTVVKGFGRGSKTLGTPTANFEQSVVDQLPESLPTGIYFGWAQIGHSDKNVYQMVTSIGWNPYFKNNVKSMETHIIHNFLDDFYGSQLKICLAGYIRDEKNFTSLDELKEAIQNDIDTAKVELAKPEVKQFAQDKFFLSEETNSVNE